jgi:transposase-like protein
MTVSPEERAQARELYVIDGLTFAQVAEITGVAESTLKRWSSEEDWRGRRADYARDIRDIEDKTLRLRKKLIDEAIEKLDPQLVYAAARLEAIAARQSKKDDAAALEVDKPAVFLEALQFIAETLKELDPEGLKVFARNYDEIVSHGKERFAQ